MFMFFSANELGPSVDLNWWTGWIYPSELYMEVAMLCSVSSECSFIVLGSLSSCCLLSCCWSSPCFFCLDFCPFLQNRHRIQFVLCVETSADSQTDVWDLWPQKQNGIPNTDLFCQTHHISSPVNWPSAATEDKDRCYEESWQTHTTPNCYCNHICKSTENVNTQLVERQPQPKRKSETNYCNPAKNTGHHVDRHSTFWSIIWLHCCWLPWHSSGCVMCICCDIRWHSWRWSPKIWVNCFLIIGSWDGCCWCCWCCWCFWFCSCVQGSCCCCYIDSVWHCDINGPMAGHWRSCGIRAHIKVVWNFEFSVLVSQSPVTNSIDTQDSRLQFIFWPSCLHNWSGNDFDTDRWKQEQTHFWQTSAGWLLSPVPTTFTSDGHISSINAVVGHLRTWELFFKKD